MLLVTFVGDDTFAMPAAALRRLVVDTDDVTRAIASVRTWLHHEDIDIFSVVPVKSPEQIEGLYVVGTEQAN